MSNILVSLLVLSAFLTGCNTPDNANTKTPVATPTASTAAKATPAPNKKAADMTSVKTMKKVTVDNTDAKKPIITIVLGNDKVIKAELYPDIAPITVANFVKLTEEGFYDGLTFHRIEPGFVIQGGDPLGNGTGGSSETIKGEFSSNGIKNDLKHTRGVLSMARSNAKDSASSQFFIMHDEAPHLDGNYAAFGKVIEGIEVVDEIVATK